MKPTVRKAIRLNWKSLSECKNEKISIPFNLTVVNKKPLTDKHFIVP